MKTKQKYYEENYTDKGIQLLHTHLRTLVDKYIVSDEDDYPKRLNPVLGMPYVEDCQLISSKDELLGRIKMLMTLLGRKEVSTRRFEFSFEDDVEVDEE